MGKLNTYQLQSQLAATLQLIGIIPGSGSSFETVRLSNAALVSFIQQYAGEDGNDGRQIELRSGSTNIEWRYAGDLTWTALIAISDLKGDPGEQIELQTTATHIQWKYSSSVDWANLVSLLSLKGTNGTDGRTMWPVNGAPSGALGADGDFANDSAVSMMYGPKTAGSWGTGTSYKGAKGDTGTGLKNRGAWATGTSYQPGDYVFSTGSATASSMWILNGEVAYVSNTLPKDDLTKWVEFVAPAGEDGTDGKSVELRKTATVIQWRLVGDAEWIDLVSLTDIRGTDGDDGTNGNTVLSTTGVPGAGIGVNGDFANDVTNSVMYGPKAAGAWPAGVSYKGGAGNDGAAGSKWLVGSGVPAAGVGVNGDFYLRDTGDVYGPKAAGAWGAVVASLKGTKGDTGTGVPAGGTAGQVLAKTSGTDYATGWVTPASGEGGGGLPTGGAVGQGLIKKTLTDGDAEWKNVLYGVAGAGDYAGFTSVALKTAFTLEVGFLGPVTWPAATKLTVAAGKTTMNFSTANQYINIAADTAALEITLPNEANNGTEIYLLVPFAITAVTWMPGTKWGSAPALRGMPSTLAPGIYQLRFFAADIVAWFFGK